MNSNYHQRETSKFFQLAYSRTLVWIIPLLILTSCSKKDDISIIRQHIEQGAKLAEKHDINGLMKLTTDDFIAMPGNRDHRQVKTIIWLAFKHYRKLKIVYPEPGISLQNNNSTATATLTFLIVRKEQTLPDLDEIWRNPKKWLNTLGENADLYQLKLAWLKKNGNWLIKEARLAPFRGTGFGQ